MPARTGAEYLNGLREPRELWFQGERVPDVTKHPLLGRMAATLAELYDLQCAPEHRDRLTYPSPTTGQPVSLAFIQPRSVGDLVRRRVMFKTTAKHLAKAELLLGVSSLLAEAIGRTGLPAYQQLLGEMVDVVETVRAYLRAAEADAVFDRYGDFVPNPELLSTERNYFPRVYPRLVEILQLIGSSGLMATPTERDLAAPEIAGDIERYYQSATLMGHERVRLFRLAWDLSCSAFAGRQVLYERFFSGDPAGLLAGRFNSYDRSAAVDRATLLLARAAPGPGPS